MLVCVILAFGFDAYLGLLVVNSLVLVFGIAILGDAFYFDDLLVLRLF